VLKHTGLHLNYHRHGVGVLQYVAVCCSALQHTDLPLEYLCTCVAVCCSMWQYVAVCCSVLQHTDLPLEYHRQFVGVL